MHDRAITDFDRALTLDPNYAAAYLNRGLAFSAGGLYDRALTDFDHAVALNPNDAKSYNSRAVTWFFKKDYNKAWADVKRCRQVGGTLHPRFIELLQQASGRRE